MNRNLFSLIFILASFGLFWICVVRQLGNSSILHPDPGFDSIPKHRSLANEEDEGEPPIQICGRVAPIPHDRVRRLSNKYSSCTSFDRPPENTTLLLLEGMETFGRTGNNLIEFLHSLQYAKDEDMALGIMPNSWPGHLITPMWMAIQETGQADWREFFERSFCVKFFDHQQETEKYKEIIHVDSRDAIRDQLFTYKYYGPLNQYIEFQGQILRTLWQSYNTGIGKDMRGRPVGDMCSVIDTMFGSERSSAEYSVIHSRSLEGLPGEILLGIISRRSGCDPFGALNMTPDYVKSILKHQGMMNKPILFLTDHQQPEILERLLADPEIGPHIHLAPEEASWVGGDITAAIMADVFIGNPASTFSGFIAKSRIALGYEKNVLFRKRLQNGGWGDSLKHRHIFDHLVVNAMA